MELIETNHAHRPFPRLGRAARRLFRSGSRRNPARRNWASDRRDYRQLLSFEDRMLRDIGITRDMVKHEMRKPFIWMG